jgi:hypothetical protein
MPHCLPIIALSFTGIRLVRATVFVTAVISPFVTSENGGEVGGLFELSHDLDLPFLWLLCLSADTIFMVFFGTVIRFKDDEAAG